MPELEQKIAAWRARLAQELGGKEDVLDELEAHLRDGAEALMQKGLAPDEAFTRMMARFGDTRTVAGEFYLLQSPGVLGMGRRGTHGLAYVAGALALAGFLFFFAFAVWGPTNPAPRSPLSGGFWHGLALALAAACFLTVRASRRFLARPNARDLRSVLAFNLLAGWMLASQAMIILRLRYPLNLALILLSLAGLLILWRQSVARNHLSPEIPL